MKSKLGSQIVVGVLIIVVAIAACNTPVPPSPTSTLVSIAQSPTIHISSASMSPDKTMKVCTAADAVALTTNGQGTDLTYAWSLDGTGQLKHTGGKGDAGSSNRYTAPPTTGEDVVKVTVTDENKQSAFDQVVITIVACLTPTPIAAPPITAPAPTKAPATTTTCNVPVCSPKQDEAVNPLIQVKGRLSQPLQAGEFLWLVSIPGGTDTFHPQPGLSVRDDNTWSVSAHIGIETDSGLQFTLTLGIANKQTDTQFNDYLSDAAKNKAWPGIPLPLPAGFKQIGQVEVVRK